MNKDCANLERMNAVVGVDVKQLDAFKKNFCLTDIVMNLYNYPEGLNSKSMCNIWLVTPSRRTNEFLFTFFIDKLGHQVHLNSGIVCQKASYLTLNPVIFAEGATASIKALLTGYYC